MSKYGGILGFISEAHDIQQELGVSPEQAYVIQQERAAERAREAELAQAEAVQAVAESNVILFRKKH